MRSIQLLNIVPASTGIGLPELAHVLCMQVLTCVLMLVYRIICRAFHHAYTVVVTSRDVAMVCIKIHHIMSEKIVGTFLT